MTFVFLLSLYVRAWFTAPDTITALCHDLQFLQSLKRYRDIHPAISKPAANKFSGHVWYLDEEQKALALSDQAVPPDTERAIVQAIVVDEEGIGIKGPKCIQIADKTIKQAYLTKFVSKDTLNFFRCLDIATGFLDADPNTWDS